MFGADGEIGTSALKLWLAVGSAVFLVSFYLLVYALPQHVISRGLRAAFVILGGGLGAVMAWALLELAALQLRTALAWSFGSSNSTRKRSLPAPRCRASTHCRGTRWRLHARR